MIKQTKCVPFSDWIPYPTGSPALCGQHGGQTVAMVTGWNH